MVRFMAALAVVCAVTTDFASAEKSNASNFAPFSPFERDLHAESNEEIKPFVQQAGTQKYVKIGKNAKIYLDLNADLGLGIKSPSYWTTYKDKDIMKTHSYAFVDAASTNWVTFKTDYFWFKVYFNLVPYRFIFLDYVSKWYLADKSKYCHQLGYDVKKNSASIKLKAQFKECYYGGIAYLTKDTGSTDYKECTYRTYEPQIPLYKRKILGNKKYKDEKYAKEKGYSDKKEGKEDGYGEAEDQGEGYDEYEGKDTAKSYAAADKKGGKDAKDTTQAFVKYNCPFYTAKDKKKKEKYSEKTEKYEEDQQEKQDKEKAMQNVEWEEDTYDESDWQTTVTSLLSTIVLDAADL